MPRILFLALLTFSFSTLSAQTVEIHQIQGGGASSPYVGAQVVTPNNIVTAVGPNGFFMQTPAERMDADEATSNGVYVFTNGANVAEGDLVDVSGTVAEYYGLTEITNPTVTVRGTVAALPPSIRLMPGDADFERFEGMLVRIEDGTVASGLDTRGAILAVAASSRPFREPGTEPPGRNGLPLWDGNREILEIELDAFGPAPAVLGGAHLGFVEGPLGYAFETYEIWAQRVEFTNPPFPRAVRAGTADELTIGSQNLQRFGANDARLAGVSQHIRTSLSAPDILAVQEVDTLAALQALADRIRNDDATIGYRAYLVEGNDPGGIDIGFLVRDGIEVTSVEAWGRNDTWIAPGDTSPTLLHDRPPLVLRTKHAGQPLTVIAVHLRSMIDVDSSSRVRAKRHEQALRLSRYVDSLQDADPSVRIAIVGDFNAFQFTDGWVDVLGQITGSPDPRGALIPATDEIDLDFTNHVTRIADSERYSYVHEGSAQVLDHALTSAALTPFVSGFSYARINADGMAASRLSDHDGFVLYLASDPPPAPTRRRAVGHRPR